MQLKEIFDDDSEDEAIGDDSDEDPDFEYRDEVQADEDDEFVPDDEDEDEEFAEASRYDPFAYRSVFCSLCVLCEIPSCSATCLPKPEQARCPYSSAVLKKHPFAFGSRR